ncbi:MAG: glutathione S-transferase family protein [Hyphomicrobiales bacterium]
MATLFHFPLDPLSRRVRLAIAEYGFEVELEEARPWEPSPLPEDLVPPAELPILVDNGGAFVSGLGPVSEYLEEVNDAASVTLFGKTPSERAETRRLAAWFDQHFYSDVSGPLLSEKIVRRFLPREAGGGSPDMTRVRAALGQIRMHLDLIGDLAEKRSWLAGRELTIADLAAAAHLSVVDYLGDVPWHENESARHWYQRIKSRPSFRPLLADYIRGLAPPRQYADLDF